MTAATLRLPRVAPHSWRRVGVLLVLAAIAAAAGIVGALVARAATAPRVPAPFAHLAVLRTVHGDVFARPQTALDRLDAPRSSDLVAGSVRRLAVMPDVPSVLSAARNRVGEVCLVAAVKQGRQFAASCVRPGVLARQGLTLQWSSSGWSAGEPFVEQGYLPRFFLAVWAPDGSIRFRTHVQGEE
jgi:hypothetical protein